MMQQNGYTDLTAGPVTGWLGFYSLKKQGRQDELASLDDNPSDTGLVWTDPKVIFINQRPYNFLYTYIISTLHQTLVIIVFNPG